MTISSSQSYVLAAIFICVLFLQVGRVSADIDENFSYIGNKSISTHTLSRGDVDGDGDIDLIIGNFNQPNELYLNDGTGTLTLAWESADSAATIATELGDLDGDGDVDLAVANSNQKNQVFINHNGVFQLAWESPFARPTTNMAMGDLDGDGRYDLIFTNKDGGTHIYRNNSVGSFELWHSLTTEYDSFAVALADMDNDGDLDIAVGYDNIGYLNGVRTELHDRVYRNDGNGQFTVFWESPEVTSAGDIIWADMDNDDDLDLFVANVEGDINQLFRNDGTTFTKIWESAEGNNSEAVDVGDIDSDGDLDVVIGNQDNVNYWLANDGNGQLTPIWHSPDNRATRDIILADLNHDGALELLVGNGDANQLFSNLLPSSIHLAWETPVEDARWLVSADFNNDTYLDLFAGYFYSESQLWLGNGTGQFTQHWIGDDPTVYVEMAAAADVDNDVDVDLAYINTNRDSEDIRILINDGSGNFTLGWQSQPDDQLSSIAWVDFDLDGDMDLTIGRIHGNSLFRNNGDGTFEEVYQFASDEDYWTRAIAWGDFDNDGDPDVIFGNGTDTTLSPNRLYRNDGSLTFTLVWESPQTSTYDLSWGDADGDGDLDLAVANFSAYNELYQNVGTSQLELSWQSDLDDNSHSRRVFWHDVDQNGRIDLVFGNARSLQLYYNQPTTFHGPSTVSLPDSTHSYANTAGDFDNDGDIDWVAWTESALFSYQNHLYQSVRQANNPPQVFLYQPQNTPRIGQISHSAIITDTIVPITYTLADLESDPVAFVEMQYSPNGGGYWLPAVATSATITANLATTPDGILHTFEWDTFASNYFGRTDQAQLRLRVHSHGDGNAPANSFVYPNKAPSAYQHPAVVTTNSTFRLQGTQIQVFSDTIGVENQVDGAYVFRASAQDSAAQPILNTIHYAKTNEAGLLGGNDSLALDDKLTAMVLITSTGWYDLYYTSASPTEEGIEPFTVTEAGVQQLVVSAENPLILFDLHISLEWVASESYLARLNDYLQQTSEIIYDLANGQAALRNIYVHQGGEQRLASDVVIHANNDMTPHATMGGAVHQPFTATVGAVQATYLPGQVHMPAEWNRFGNETDAVGSDWAATLAHELAHYFFFLPDNYIGYEDGGLLQPTDCQGSAMTDAYHYSEFLTRSEWRDDCLITVGNQAIGLADWEIIEAIYPFLNTTDLNPGPTSLPIALTTIILEQPPNETPALNDPVFTIRNPEGGLHTLTSQAKAYMIKGQSTEHLQDDRVILLGNSAQRSVLHARGIEVGDRLCLIDQVQGETLNNCITVTERGRTVSLQSENNWNPQIIMHSVTSRTLAITVTQSTVEQLTVQLYPTPLFTDTGVITAPIITLNKIDEDTFAQTITLGVPTVSGHIRIKVPNSTQEKLISYYYGGGWGPSISGWGPSISGWGPSISGWGPSISGWGPSISGWGANVAQWHINRSAWRVGHWGWNAPVFNNDGQVMIFNPQYMFGVTPPYAIQTVAAPSNLPSWLSPISNAYYVSLPTTITGTSTIQFRYFERDVGENEDILFVYYSPDNGVSWQQLPTIQDSFRNQISASLLGEGVYVPVLTNQLPAFSSAGWQSFGYVVRDSRSITEALASIDGDYATVYRYKQTYPWEIYDSTIPEQYTSLVNTLESLEFGQGYFIHITRPVTLYLGIANSRNIQSNNLAFPPSTFYGSVTGSSKWMPSAGQIMTTTIDGEVCGYSSLVDLETEIAFAIQVQAESFDTPGSCGRKNSLITFFVDGVDIGTARWDNSQANRLNLTFKPTTTITLGQQLIDNQPVSTQPIWLVGLILLTILVSVRIGLRGGFRPKT